MLVEITSNSALWLIAIGLLLVGWAFGMATAGFMDNCLERRLKREEEEWNQQKKS